MALKMVQYISFLIKRYEMRGISKKQCKVTITRFLCDINRNFVHRGVNKAPFNQSAGSFINYKLHLYVNHHHIECGNPMPVGLINNSEEWRCLSMKC